MSPIGSAAILWAAAARRGLNPVLKLLRARATPAGSAGALNLQVYECERCDWEQRLNIWQRNGRSTDTNKSRPLCPSVRPRARPGQFARIRSMKFIGLLARSGHAASERGGRRAEGCERARRAAAFRVPTEPKNLRPHGARLVRFFSSRAGGSGG